MPASRWGMNSLPRQAPPPTNHLRKMIDSIDGPDIIRLASPSGLPHPLAVPAPPLAGFFCAVWFSPNHLANSSGQPTVGGRWNQQTFSKLASIEASQLIVY